MLDLQKIDYFADNPIQQFVGAGFEKYRPHWHWERNIANASLYYIADGSLDFEFADSSFTAKKGDVVFLKKSDTAVIRNKTENYSSLYYIAFNYDESRELSMLTYFEDTPYSNLFKDILDAHRSMSHYSNLKICHLFHKLLYSLLMDSLQTREDYILTSRIYAAAEYININYYKNISMEKLCSITGYSPAHLRRLFSKTFGTSPQSYILDKRIEIAKELLLEVPEKNVDEIADLLGMSSTSYFCKMFKAKTGTSPIIYRKNSSAENS
ncbi:MAG: helix-turn-helix transcriptional regulator [Clostridia bacterium]|nr:helix-turn-helix transcriptional regulator [Clostridia bacterium]